MKIVYLDQNKSIALARHSAAPEAHPAAYALLRPFDRAVRAGAVVAPLDDSLNMD